MANLNPICDFLGDTLEKTPAEEQNSGLHDVVNLFWNLFNQTEIVC